MAPPSTTPKRRGRPPKVQQPPQNVVKTAADSATVAVIDGARAGFAELLRIVTLTDNDEFGIAYRNLIVAFERAISLYYDLQSSVENGPMRKALDEAKVDQEARRAEADLKIGTTIAETVGDAMVAMTAKGINESIAADLVMKIFNLGVLLPPPGGIGTSPFASGFDLAVKIAKATAANGHAGPVQEV